LTQITQVDLDIISSLAFSVVEQELGLFFHQPLGSRRERFVQASSTHHASAYRGRSIIEYPASSIKYHYSPIHQFTNPLTFSGFNIQYSIVNSQCNMLVIYYTIFKKVCQVKYMFATEGLARPKGRNQTKKSKCKTQNFGIPASPDNSFLSKHLCKPCRKNTYKKQEVTRL
jgi:hypothetical protein